MRTAAGSGSQLELIEDGPPGRRSGRFLGELAGAVAAGHPPSLQLAVVGPAGTAMQAWGGLACAVGDPTPSTRSTLYDLASLTKVTVTVPLAVWLEQRGSWALDDAVARWVPRFPRTEITLRHLLTHTSGLPAHRPFYHLGRGRPTVERALFAEARSAGAPGPVLYSDLNFILLGWAVARCAGTPLDRLTALRIAAPLGMTTARFRPPAGRRTATAATELDGDQRLEPGLIWGTVHDGNAAALGGVAGHAGLFGTAWDLAAFARPLLGGPPHPLLSPSSIAAMSTAQAGRPPEVRGLGWRIGAPAEWGRWPASTLWHTGFTGTSLLIAPAVPVAVALVSNGVHPHRAPAEQAALREHVHRWVARAWG